MPPQIEKAIDDCVARLPEKYGARAKRELVLLATKPDYGEGITIIDLLEDGAALMFATQVRARFWLFECSVVSHSVRASVAI